MKKETYKVIHPTIKEISIGDKFICNNGTIVTFVAFYSELLYPILTDIGWYSKILLMNNKDSNESPYNIKYKIPSLKDKIDLL